MVIKDENAALRRRSGEITSDEPLHSFLYLLMRDHLPAGTVEALVRQSNAGDAFTNGYLANYAKDIAYRLRKK